MTAQPLEPRVSRLEGAFEQIVERLGDTNVRLERLEYKVDANYHALDDKITALGSAFEARFAGIDQKFPGIDQKFAAMEQRFVGIDQKFAGIDQKFVGIDQKFASMDQKFDSRFHFLIGTYLTTTIALAGIFFAALFPLYRHIAQ